MEIEINDTPATNDDLVELKCDHPAHQNTVNCRIRATAAGPASTVVLTNPDGRLRFPGPGDTTTTLTVPGDYQAELPADPMVGNVARTYARMAADLRQGTRTAPSFDDAVALHRVIAAIETAAADGKTLDEGCASA